MLYSFYATASDNCRRYQRKKLSTLYSLYVDSGPGMYAREMTVLGQIDRAVETLAAHHRHEARRFVRPDNLGVEANATGFAHTSPELHQLHLTGSQPQAAHLVKDALFQQDNIRPAGLGQMISDATAGDATANNDNSSLIYHNSTPATT
jgi:hypothetical protein